MLRLRQWQLSATLLLQLPLPLLPLLQLLLPLALPLSLLALPLPPEGSAKYHGVADASHVLNSDHCTVTGMGKDEAVAVRKQFGRYPRRTPP